MNTPAAPLPACACNLLEKYSSRPALRREIAEYRQQDKARYCDENPEFSLKTGDSMLFLNGNGARMIGEIWAFNTEGRALIIWDCYWFPVDMSTRLIQKT